MRAESFRFPSALTTAVNDFASGLAPSFLKRFVAGGVSIALKKSETAVRPLACGDPIRRLVAKCFCVGGKEDISLAFKDRNYGVGCPGGVEVVAHSLRDTLETHKTSKFGLLKIDFRNAFNEIKRDHFVKKVSEMFPAMSSWTQWCYGESTMLLYDHEHIIESQAGVQQGDPLGPLYFCCGLNGLVNEIAKLNPVYNKWYMDDGGIVGDVELLKKVWDLLKTRGPALGLHLNPSKCEWSWLDPSCPLPCPIRLDGVSDENQVKLVPTSEIQMLGVPLGNDAFVSNFVEKKLIGNLCETVSKLVEFEDSQAASYLLRVSYSIVRAVHFMRTTPLHQWEKQGEKFDGMMQDAAGKILGTSMSERASVQAALTPKLGGLGLRRVVEHGGFAYSASWHESKKQSGENWTRPNIVPETYVSQKEASFQFDDQMYKFLVDSAPNEREKQRLLCLAKPHAGAFVTAAPSNEDGNDTIMRPRVFRTAILYRLGLPVLNRETPCPLCVQTINIYGDHATCCATHGDLIVRHNAMRNLVNSIAADGIMGPVMEKKGILGVTSGRRPGDVSIPDWSASGPLAIDVAITSPLIESHVSLPNVCEEYALSKKHRKYDASFEGSNYSFCAMVFETFGALNPEGEEVLRQIFRFAAKHQGKEFTSYCSRAWARVSCTLQKTVAQTILNRIDGNKESVVEEQARSPSVVPSAALFPAIPPQIPRYVPPVREPASAAFSPAIPPQIPRYVPPVRKPAPQSPSVGEFVPQVRESPREVPPEVPPKFPLKSVLSPETKVGPQFFEEKGEKKGREAGREEGGSVAAVVASSSSGSSRSISTNKINIIVREVGHGGNKKDVQHSEKYIPSHPVVVVASSSSSSSDGGVSTLQKTPKLLRSSYSSCPSTPQHTYTIHHEKSHTNAGIPAARPTPHSPQRAACGFP